MTELLTRPQARTHGASADARAEGTIGSVPRGVPAGPAVASVPGPVAASVPAPARKAAPVGSSVRALLRLAGRVFMSVLLTTAVAVFLFLAVGPRFLGYQTSTMLTGSMAPLINPGDVVVTFDTPASELNVGDIITYHIPVQDHRVETHRIIDITRNADGATTVRTKGDANNGADPWAATLTGSHADRHAFTVPYLGHAIRALREPMVLKTLMYGAPAAAVLILMTAIWRKTPDAEDAPATNLPAPAAEPAKTPRAGAGRRG
ncbi:MAG TPA: signal peptidase I [Arthrobacter sp.]|nr:signal peptidase I [Arthrobacter sp.]